MVSSPPGDGGVCFVPVSTFPRLRLRLNRWLGYYASNPSPNHPPNPPTHKLTPPPNHQFAHSLTSSTHSLPHAAGPSLACMTRLDVWNLIPGEGSAELVKALVKEKIQVRVTAFFPRPRRAVVPRSRSYPPFPSSYWPLLPPPVLAMSPFTAFTNVKHYPNTNSKWFLPDFCLLSHVEAFFRPVEFTCVERPSIQTHAEVLRADLFFFFFNFSP